MLYDTHIHLGFILESQILEICNKFSSGFLCSCAQDIEDFSRQQSNAEKLQKAGITTLCALGIHPLYLNSLDVYTLEKAITEKSFATKKIVAIGEIGLDFYTQELKDNTQNQENVFAMQLELAIKYNLSVIVHLRKAVGKVFSFVPLLKKCPSVYFHAFEGKCNEANALLKRGVNAYFGIGKTLLKGDKSAADLVKSFDKSRLLFETDSPYQTLRGEEYSSPLDVLNVIKKANEISSFDFFSVIKNNTERAFSTALCKPL